MDPVHSGFKEGMQTSVYAKKNTEWNQSTGTKSASLTFHCTLFGCFFLRCSARTDKQFGQVGQRKEPQCQTQHNGTATHKLDCGVPVPLHCFAINCDSHIRNDSEGVLQHFIIWLCPIPLEQQFSTSLGPRHHYKFTFLLKHAAFSHRSVTDPLRASFLLCDIFCSMC